MVEDFHRYKGTINNQSQDTAIAFRLSIINVFSHIIKLWADGVGLYPSLNDTCLQWATYKQYLK